MSTIQYDIGDYRVYKRLSCECVAVLAVFTTQIYVALRKYRGNFVSSFMYHADHWHLISLCYKRKIENIQAYLSHDLEP